MYPLIWRSINFFYWRIFLLSNLIFASVLVLMRVYEIARFATLGSSGFSVFIFTLLQFPQIFPLAIPLSCAIAATIVSQKMSQNSELTSLRTCGLSIKEIFTPLIYQSIWFSILNFFIIFCVTPSIKQATKNLIVKVTMQNPITLLQNGKIGDFQQGVLKMKIKKNSKKVDDFLFAYEDPLSKRIHLILAEKIYSEDFALLGKNVDIFYSLNQSNKSPLFYLEHSQSLHQPISLPLLNEKKKNSKKVIVQKLSLSGLIHAIQSKEISFKKKKECLFEGFRRLYLSVGPFLLTYCGLIWGIDISRRGAKRFRLMLFLLITQYFLVYLTAKGMKHLALLSGAYLTLSFLIIFFLTKRHLNHLEEGKETCF
jgi:lipopolysaccharide export system permease protein